jgi:ATP-dependent helicase/nuclease subunit B
VTDREKTGVNLFTIAAGEDFAQSLARGLIARMGHEPLALSRSIIYLPTRRAARGFGESFASLLGGSALLPQFRALGGGSGGDDEDDELDFDSVSQGMDLPPAIDPVRRQLLLAALIRRWDMAARGGALNAVQALNLGDSLAALMDEVERQGADLGKLKELAPPHLAAHWNDVTGFLELIRDNWPGILKEEGCINPAARRNAALTLLTDRLAKRPADDQTSGGMVIAAGSTGSIPATARLLSAIARLPNGAVVLPGLDRKLDEKSWSDLDPGHPQFGMKQLLEQIGGARGAVADWDGGDARPDRVLLLREALRPAPTTDAWRAIADRGAGAIANGLNGLSLIAANDPAEEALAIALALRHALENETRTAALVTPDRNLARRVAAELTRWDIAIDDSAGRPLAHTSAGAFLSLVVEAAEAKFAPVPLLALLKHPFATLGGEPGPFRAEARLLDRYVLRGPRPDPGLAGIRQAIAAARANKRKPAEILEGLAAWWDRIGAILEPLERCFAQKETSLAGLIQIHLAAAEKLACHDPKDCPLWRGPDGEAAAEMFNNLLEAASGLPEGEPRSYPALLRALAMKVPVRPRFARRAIAILGPLEARLQHFDLTILGGLNEGTWPSAPPADPWFSRPMRIALGMELPERRIGLAAHDFAILAAGPEVLLTRAVKADGAPTIASRWLERLTQLTRGLGLAEKLKPPADYLAMARALSDVPPAPRIRRPAPTPPVTARPRRLSVTEIETWLRDPYAIYAKHVLKLLPLDALDEEVGPLERGTVFHRALELFVGRYPGTIPADALARLVAIAEEVFAGAQIPGAQRAIWRPRFLSAARWFVAQERERRGGITASHLEVPGRMTFDAPGGAFLLTGKADRIDMLAGGGAAILDYKTGSLPDKKWMVSFLTPQLPLEGAILVAGGFDGLPVLEPHELIYLRLSGGAKGGETKVYEGVMAADAKARLAERIAWFDDAATPYHSRVAPHSAKSIGDYDHLARVREWAPSGWTEET